MKTNRVILLMLALLGVTLVQNAQAFYNPSTGRWLSRDPSGEKTADGPNIYASVANNPVNRFDTDGRTGWGAPFFPPSSPVTEEPPDPRVPPGVPFDPSKPWKICCRPVNIDGLGWLTHCDHRQGPCDTPDSVEFPITRDTGCCKIKSDREMSQCLHDNKNDAGHGLPGNNCQSSSKQALKKCCAKSSWSPSWYADVPCADPPPVYFPPLGY